MKLHLTTVSYTYLPLDFCSEQTLLQQEGGLKVLPNFALSSTSCAMEKKLLWQWLQLRVLVLRHGSQVIMRPFSSRDDFIISDILMVSSQAAHLHSIIFCLETLRSLRHGSQNLGISMWSCWKKSSWLCVSVTWLSQSSCLHTKSYTMSCCAEPSADDADATLALSLGACFAAIFFLL